MTQVTERASSAIRNARLLDLSWIGRHMDEAPSNVLEERVQIQLLLVPAADGHERLLADDRHHRLGVKICIVESIEQVDCARPGRFQAHPTLPVYFACAQAMKAAPSSWGVATKRGRLPARWIPPNDAIDAVDAVARITEDALYASVTQPPNDEITHSGGVVIVARHDHGFLQANVAPVGKRRWDVVPNARCVPARKGKCQQGCVNPWEAAAPAA
jgi:hypothetical protein